MGVLRRGVLVCKHERYCPNRVSDRPFGCELASQCPNYSENNFFKCDTCGKLCDLIIQHRNPDFNVCVRCAEEIARHLLEDITRAKFDLAPLSNISERDFQIVLESIKAKSPALRRNR